MPGLLSKTVRMPFDRRTDSIDSVHLPTDARTGFPTRLSLSPSDRYARFTFLDGSPFSAKETKPGNHREPDALTTAENTSVR